MKTRLFFILLCALLCGCNKLPEKDMRPPQPHLLLVSVGPYKEIVEKIAGTNFIVQPVVPLNANPHTYEPSSKRVSELAKASLWFQIGEPFEPKLLDALRLQTPQMAIYDLRTNISLLSEETHSCKSCSHTSFDRHIWLSPKLVKEQAIHIAAALEKIFPQEGQQFFLNAEKLQKELGALDAEIGARMRLKGPQAVLVSHPAFAYFCKDYNLKQLSIEYEGKDPRPKHLEEVYAAAKELSVAVALTFPQHNNKGAEVLAEKLSISVHSIDPYSPEYFRMMHDLVALIENRDKM